MVATASKAPRKTDVTDDYAMDRQALHDAIRRGPSYWRPKDGKNTIRILWLKGRGDFCLTATQHFNIGPERHTIFCPEAMLKTPCAVCAEQRALRRSSDPDDAVTAKDLRPKVQYFAAIIDCSKPESGVQIYPFGQMVMTQLGMVVDDEDWGHPFHPIEGRNFQIEKTQVGTQKWEIKYTVFPAAKTSPIANREWEDDALELIDGIVQFTPQSQVKAWLDGVTAEVEAPEEQAPTIVRRGLRPAAVAQSRDAEDEEESEPEDEDPAYAPAAVAPVKASRPAAVPARTPTTAGKVPASAAERLRARLAEASQRKAS